MHVHVADTFAVAEHGDAAVLGDVADKFVRSARHDQVDFFVQRQDLRHILARMNQDNGIGRNIGERRQRVAPDRNEHGVGFGCFRAALEAHRVARLQCQGRNLRNDVRARLEHHAHDAQRARLLVQHEIVVQLHRRKAPVQRIGQARDIAHARGHFRDASLRRPQARKHRARQFAAFDGRLRRRAILFVRGQNFFRARFDRVSGGEQRLVPALARKRRQDVRGFARTTDEMMNVG